MSGDRRVRDVEAEVERQRVHNRAPERETAAEQHDADRNLDADEHRSRRHGATSCARQHAASCRRRRVVSCQIGARPNTTAVTSPIATHDASMPASIVS